MKSHWVLGFSVIVAAFVIVAAGIVFSLTQTSVKGVAADGIEQSVRDNGGKPVSNGEQKFGAVSVLQAPLEVSGTRLSPIGLPFKSGTSTVVNFKLPNATTTGTVACKQTSGLSFAQEYEIAVGISPGATTTASLGKLYVPANGASAVVATTSAFTFNPNYYINVKMATTSGTTVSSALAPVGHCSVLLLEI